MHRPLELESPARAKKPVDAAAGIHAEDGLIELRRETAIAALTVNTNPRGRERMDLALFPVVHEVRVEKRRVDLRVSGNIGGKRRVADEVPPRNTRVRVVLERARDRRLDTVEGAVAGGVAARETIGTSITNNMDRTRVLAAPRGPTTTHRMRNWVLRGA